MLATDTKLELFGVLSEKYEKEHVFQEQFSRVLKRLVQTLQEIAR
jgi:hypothetical protein